MKTTLKPLTAKGSRIILEFDSTENMRTSQAQGERRPIPGYPRYEVSIDGRVFSLPKKKHTKHEIELKQWCSRRYMVVQLWRDNIGKTLYVHRLVAMAFHGLSPDDKPQVRHLDGNAFNNAADNLMWGTASEDADDRKRHGTMCGGPIHSEKVKEGIRNGMPLHERNRRIREGQIKGRISRGVSHSEEVRKAWARISPEARKARSAKAVATRLRNAAAKRASQASEVEP